MSTHIQRCTGSLWGWLLKFLVVTGLLVSASAHAAVQVNCAGDVLSDLESSWMGKGPDYLALGVPLRDWTPAVVAEWRRQALACINRETSWGESLKDSVRLAINGAAERRSSSLAEERDALNQKQRQQQDRQKLIASQRLTLVRVQADGQPESITVQSLNQQEDRFYCSNLRNAPPALTLESFRQMLVFIQLCADSGLLQSGDWVPALKQRAAQAPALYAEMDAMSAAMKAGASNPSAALLHSWVAQIKQINARHVQAGFARYADDTSTTAGLMQQLREVEAALCVKTFAQSGLPAAWQAAYLLMEPNSPEHFAPVICTAVNNGAKVRALKDDGFEVRSAQRVVQVFVQARRIAGADPKVALLVPVRASIDGRGGAINNGADLRTVMIELGAASANR